MLRPRSYWNPAEFGQFIDLQAFYRCADLAKPDAMLPSWRQIRANYPELIDDSNGGEVKHLFVTHRWDQPGHPDPRGWQLRALHALAKHYNHRQERCCVWYDYMSLPQAPRDAAESVIFKAGLSNIRTLVTSCQNIALISRAGANHRDDLDAMLSRGWVVAELYLARSRRIIPLPLYEREDDKVAYGRQHSDWDAVVPDLHAIAPLDSAQALEAWFQHKGIVCTNGSDLTFLSQQLHDEFSAYDDKGPPPKVEFEVPMQLEDRDMIRLAIPSANGLSLRFPDIYLAQSARDSETNLWTVVFRHRPAPLPLNLWHDLGDGDLTARLIDPSTFTSPMYPGIRFELSPDERQIRACVR